MIHHLKTDPEMFDAVHSGRKGFEIRKELDRHFSPGDQLVLQETKYTGWEMSGGGFPLIYTGREITLAVTYVMHGPSYGLAPGWCIMSLSKIPQ